jgi:hypothetical protein
MRPVSPGAGLLFANNAARGYNSAMKLKLAKGISFTIDHRLVVVCLVLAHMISHPVPARDLHYCSLKGELIQKGSGYRGSSSSGLCCAGQSAPGPASCCSGAEEKKEIPADGASISWPPCAGCCREYSLAGIDPLVAASVSPAAGLEMLRRDIASGAVESWAFLPRPAVSWLTEPSDLPGVLPIFLLTCRFLI